MSDNCLFCGIVRGDVPATVVRDDERTLAFRDVNPQAPTHVLVIPKAHHPDVGSLIAADPGLLVDVVCAATEVARAEGLAGWRLVTNTGPDSGQTVFHLHLHVLGGRQFRWPPG